MVSDSVRTVCRFEGAAMGMVEKYKLHRRRQSVNLRSAKILGNQLRLNSRLQT